MQVHEIDIKSYSQASDYLMGKIARKLAHNTWLVHRDTHIELTYHGHAIVRYYLATEFSPAHLVVHNCGYQTSTTKTRLNCVLPSRYGIFQRNWNWYVHDYQKDTDMPYYNGMAFDTP